MNLKLKKKLIYKCSIQVLNIFLLSEKKKRKINNES